MKTVSLSSRVRELDGIMIAVRKGRSVVVKGRSGVGKSLMLDCLGIYLGNCIIIKLAPLTIRQALLQAADSYTVQLA